MLASLAVWWAVGPPGRTVPVRAPVLSAAGDAALAPRTRVVLGGGSALAAASVVPLPWWGRLAAALVVGVCVTFGLGLIRPDRTGGEAERRENLPEALTLLACGVEAGLPLGSVVHAVGPSLPGVVGDDLARVASALDLGLSERAAWGLLVESEAWRRTAADIGRVAASGAAVAPMLRRHEEQALRAAHDARLARARTTGVRSVFPLMVCFLPAFVLVGVVPAIGGVVVRFFG
ncbi:type II secretion system F family protein [Mariniluteicoccus endophyticus]